MVRGHFAVPMQTSSVSFFFEHSYKSYIRLDSQRIVLKLCKDINHVNEENEIEL